MGDFFDSPVSQTRRTILKLIVPAIVLIAGGWNIFRRKAAILWSSRSYPIQNATIGKENFSGDHPEKTHAILWAKEKNILEMGGIPPPSEHFKVAVIGAGMAGLASAYYLKDLQPVILDQSEQFGGNSRGEAYKDSLFSIGAAYIVTPDAGSVPYNLLNSLGLESEARVHQGELQVLEKGNIRSNFWSAHQAAFKKLQSIYKSSYPAIPFDADGSLSKEEFNKLDLISFLEWSKKNLSKSLELEAFLRGYCYSAFGGDLHELSTTQVLSFLTSDLSSVSVFPGGNSFVAQRLSKYLEREIPLENLRPKTLVVDIQVRDRSVQTTYINQEGKLQSFTSDFCIMAGPKFVAQKLIDQLPKSQSEAIHSLKYRAYLVINIILNKKTSSLGYDFFNLDALQKKPAALGPSFTDLIFAGWAQQDQTNQSVLTLYKPIPYDHGRSSVYASTAYKQVLDEIDDGLSLLLKTLQISREDILDIRIARHGHALPLAATGLIANGTLERARSSIGKRVFFANQDNWANPCFETAVISAEKVAKEILA